MWESLDTEGSCGSGNGIIIKDEEYKNSCRITLEKCSGHHEITCGVYGAMVHTVYCGDNCQEIYDSMKTELQEFIDKNTTPNEEYEFYDYFTNKY